MNTTSHYMLVLYVVNGAGEHDGSEVVDLDKGAICNTNASNTINWDWGSYGGLVNQTAPFVCGGLTEGWPSDPWPGCYNLAGEQVATMIELRSFAAIVAISKYINTQKCNQSLLSNEQKHI
jgi:hypothetical protein